MRKKSPKKNNQMGDFLFFSGFVILCVSTLIITLTFKNECIFLKKEIHHLNSIKASHLNRVKLLEGDVKNFSKQSRIEKVAFEEFQLYVPSPESLVVYMRDM
tara:strand:- start:308 stop:613 length:306 start_codon:yes stop_codon:yes gene_type:complete